MTQLKTLTEKIYVRYGRCTQVFFKNMGQSRPLFVYFRSFPTPTTISIIQIEKSLDGVLEIRTQGRRMVGVDKTTEIWRHP